MFLPEGGGRASSRGEGTRTPANRWLNALRGRDAERLWAELHRVVCQHPLARAVRAELLFDESGRGPYADLTQELFVQLLSKNRFQHYVDAGLTDAQIEVEIKHIELSNLLTGELRQRRPESYRLARRVSDLVRSGVRFRRFDQDGGVACRLSGQVYGLLEWPAGKPTRARAELEQRVKRVPVRRRDTRTVGRTADTHLVISNAELEELIAAVLEACDAPLDVRTLRGLVMSRLTIIDAYLDSPGGDGGEEERAGHEPVAYGDPERFLLIREQRLRAGRHAEGFLRDLRAEVRGKARQYRRMLDVLWHFYLLPHSPTQLEVAAGLGVSDSLISDYRRRLEARLRKFSFLELEGARHFEEALREQVGRLRAEAEGEQLPVRGVSFLQKPFTPDAVLRKAREVLDARQ